jgi:hypothetical protein
MANAKYSSFVIIATILILTKVLFSCDNLECTLLNHAKEEVVKHYLTQTNGAGWIYKEGQFEVYHKTDFKMYLKPLFKGKTPKPEGALCTPDTKDEDLGKTGRRMVIGEYQQFEEFKKRKSPVAIGDKKVVLANKGYLNNPPKYEFDHYCPKKFPHRFS